MALMVIHPGERRYQIHISIAFTRPAYPKAKQDGKGEGNVMEVPSSLPSVFAAAPDGPLSSASQEKTFYGA